MYINLNRGLTDTVLWTIWLAWGSWILCVLYPQVNAIKWSALLLTVGGGMLFFQPLLVKEHCFMRLFKKERKTVKELGQDMMAVDTKITPPGKHTDLSSPTPEEMGGIKPIKTRKDTFVSSEACLSGDLEGQGNIVIEGRMKGNIRSSHQVRIESGGITEGDIYAQHIVVNGYVLGDLHAETVTLQSEGRIEGAIFADELVIEKGGNFTGHSEMKKKSEKLPVIVTVKQTVMTGDEALPEELVVLHDRTLILSKKEVIT